ncbi:MAG: hypothetical protein Q7T56_01220 [Nocardioidaceae bacterium]|nr:hypothetical protein [Nocardioidaceae bacterium]
MTAVLTPPVEPADWGSTMPAWGLAADLTPPEVIEGRQVRAIRKRLVVGLAAIVLVCVAGFAFATLQATTAEDSLASTQAATDELMAAQGQYDDVVKVQADTRAVDAQVAQLMATDVDVATLVTELRGTLPGTMSLTALNVTLTSATDAAAPPVAATDPAAEPGSTPIGTVTLTGSAQQLSDLAGYATDLAGIDGVANVLPASNAKGEAGATTWTVTLGITDALHTHRYDLDAPSDGGQS